MKLQIITRGNAKHGLGHLFRTRTFSNVAKGSHQIEILAIIERGLENIFYELLDILKIIRDDNEIVSNVEEFKPDILIFDLTYLDRKIFNLISKSVVATVSISPVFNNNDNVSLLFLRSKHFKFVEGVKIFGGLEYSIFNEYCKFISDETYNVNINKSQMPISVSMGGTDSQNKTLQIIESLVKFPFPLTIWVALGEGYAHSYNKLVEEINKNHTHEIILAKANKSTWDILGNSVIAILAGGLTTIEAVFAGLPSINIFEKEEHINATAQELFDLGIVENSNLLNPESLILMTERLKYYYFNRSELLQLRKKSLNLIDKNGSSRVLKEIENHYKTVKK